MRNICLNFYGLGIDSEMQAYVIIDDIYEGFTYNGKLFVCLDSNKAYKLTAISCGEVISIVFYVDRIRDCYYFYFPRSIIRNSVVTFYLTDSFYKDLIIEKGEIILWKK